MNSKETAQAPADCQKAKEPRLQLTQTESSRFVNALVAPVKRPTKRMRSALALHRKTVTEKL